VFTARGELHHLLDVNDPGCSNWVSYVNPAPTFPARNLVACQHNLEIYFYTIAPILAGAELFIWNTHEVPRNWLCLPSGEAAAQPEYLDCRDLLPSPEMGAQDDAKNYQRCSAVYTKKDGSGDEEESIDVEGLGQGALPSSAESPSVDSRLQVSCGNKDQTVGHGSSHSVPGEEAAQACPERSSPASLRGACPMTWQPYSPTLWLQNEPQLHLSSFCSGCHPVESLSQAFRGACSTIHALRPKLAAAPHLFSFPARVPPSNPTEIAPLSFFLQDIPPSQGEKTY
ncbi:hypothetical protein lerEdw1_009461, partial [Lerista edwardsae]